MKNKIKKLPLYLSLIAMLFFASGSYIISKAAAENPDYSGRWDIAFYDASGTLLGGRTITVSEDGSISDKTNMSINNTVYLTEISCSILANGKIQDGNLTDTDRLDMKGLFSGSFTESEGNGKWKNYYNTSGTWIAKRSTKKDKHD